jgi:hypothetical protein
MPHCLAVNIKIEQVMTVDAHLGPSLFRVFPRTMSTVLPTTWDVIIVDEDPQEIVEDFETSIGSFIASHSTADDQHELLTQLQSPRKPQEIKVQSFHHPLREVNGYVEWMPGTEPHPNKGQIKQAFFDSVPTSWRERFESAGHSNSSMTVVQILHCFTQQEKLVI